MYNQLTSISVAHEFSCKVEGGFVHEKTDEHVILLRDLEGHEMYLRVPLTEKMKAAQVVEQLQAWLPDVIVIPERRTGG